MKYRLYSQAGGAKLEMIRSAGLLENFEVTENEALSPDEMAGRSFDAIETGGESLEAFRPFLGVIDWKTSQIGRADVLTRESGKYKPHNVLAEAIMRVLKSNTSRIDSQRPVIIIGGTYFVLTVTLKLALSGFGEIIVSLIDASPEETLELEKNIRKIVFDLNLRVIPINDLTSAEQAGFLLISDFKKEKNKDAYELLTYFNFLSEGAVFIDCNSIKDPFLVDDARKAEIFVIDELAILKTKYEYLLEILKNSP